MHTAVLIRKNLAFKEAKLLFVTASLICQLFSVSFFFNSKILSEKFCSIALSENSGNGLFDYLADLDISPEWSGSYWLMRFTYQQLLVFIYSNGF